MKVSIPIVLAALLVAMAVPPSSAAQSAPRRLAFADLAAVVLQSNLQLRAAAFDVTVAQAQLAQAQGARAPQAGISAAYTRTQELPPLDPNIYAAGVTISYPLSTGGNLEARVRLAEANLRGAQATYERARQQIVYAAEQTYLQALLAGESVAAAERALAQASESLRVAQARLRAGVAAQFDVLQAEVAVANAEQNLAQAQTGAATARAALNAALALPLDTALDLADTLAPRSVNVGLVDAISRARRDRPDLIALRSRIEAARAALEVAQSGGRPTVGLGVGYTFSNAEGQFSYVFGTWSATLSVTLSVFDGGVTQAQVRQAQQQLEQLQVSEAQVQQQAELDVRTAWLALERAAAELTAAGKAVEQGRESVRLAAARYQAGIGTSLELLSAQAGLAQAEQSLAAARFDQNLARIQLMLAVGSQ